MATVVVCDGIASYAILERINPRQTLDGNGLYISPFDAGKTAFRTESDDRFDGNVVMLESRSFRATFFNIFDNVDTGKLLKITTDNTFVVTQFVGKSANRLGIVVFQVIEQVKATTVEDILGALPSKDERVRETVLCECFRECNAEFQAVIDIYLLALEVVRIWHRGWRLFELRHIQFSLTVVRTATDKSVSIVQI
jgi:hypothetical protein